MERTLSFFARKRVLYLGPALFALGLSACTVGDVSGEHASLVLSAPYSDIRIPPRGSLINRVCASYKTLGVAVRYVPAFPPAEGRNRDPEKSLTCTHKETNNARILLVQMPPLKK